MDQCVLGFPKASALSLAPWIPSSQSLWGYRSLELRKPSKCWGGGGVCSRCLLLPAFECPGLLTPYTHSLGDPEPGRASQPWAPQPEMEREAVVRAGPSRLLSSGDRQQDGSGSRGPAVLPAYLSEGPSGPGPVHAEPCSSRRGGEFLTKCSRPGHAAGFAKRRQRVQRARCKSEHLRACDTHEPVTHARACA